MWNDETSPCFPPLNPEKNRTLFCPFCRNFPSVFPNFWNSTTATASAAALYVLISSLMPISGAHFNPVVSLVDWANKKLKTSELIIYFICQFLGAIFSCNASLAIIAKFFSFSSFVFSSGVFVYNRKCINLISVSI